MRWFGCVMSTACLLTTTTVTAGPSPSDFRSAAAIRGDFSPNTPVMTALRRMQQERLALAVVADGSGRTAGIVTLKDLVEEIVGELRVW